VTGLIYRQIMLTRADITGRLAKFILLGGDMKQFIIAAAILAATSISAWAQVAAPPSNGPAPAPGSSVGAPAPLLAAGPVGLVIVAGYGVYWLVKRRRKAS
jgi:hypothetical protein